MITPCDHSYDPTQLDSTKPFSLVGSFGVIAATIRLNQTVRLSRVVWCDHGCDPTRLNGLVELDRIVWCDRTFRELSEFSLVVYVFTLCLKNTCHYIFTDNLDENCLIIMMFGALIS